MHAADETSISRRQQSLIVPVPLQITAEIWRSQNSFRSGRRWRCERREVIGLGERSDTQFGQNAWLQRSGYSGPEYEITVPRDAPRGRQIM